MAADSHTTQITKDPKPPRTWKLRCGNSECACEWIAGEKDARSKVWHQGELSGFYTRTFYCPKCSYILDVKHKWRTNIGWFGLWIRTPF